MAMNLEQMRECKHALGYSNETIAELSGVPVATVRKIFGGVTRNPRQKTMEALTKVLQKGMRRENDTNAGFMSGPGSSAALSGRGTSYDDIPENAAGVRETSSAYKPQEKVYTMDDIEALPENVRAELIDGKIYYMAAPTRTHQKIAGKMYIMVSNYIEGNGGDCEAYIAPFGVYLNADDSIFVEPDLIVVCDPSRMEERGCIGAPDWVVEVVSPSSGKMDYSIKMNKYRTSGVCEYWVIDPRTRTVMVFLFGENGATEDVSMHSFDEEVHSSVFPDLGIRLSEHV